MSSNLHANDTSIVQLRSRLGMSPQDWQQIRDRKPSGRDIAPLTTEEWCEAILSTVRAEA